MAKVEIYTTNACPYCFAAKSLLAKKNVAFTEIDVGGDDKLRASMMQRTGGRRSVPQVFVGQTHVGGCDDLHALDKAGGLDRLLAA